MQRQVRNIGRQGLVAMAIPASNFLVATFCLTLTGAITTQGTFWLYAGFGIAAVLFFAFPPGSTASSDRFLCL